MTEIRVPSQKGMENADKCPPYEPYGNDVQGEREREARKARRREMESGKKVASRVPQGTRGTLGG